MSYLLIFIFCLLKTYINCTDYQGKDAYLGCFVDNRLARDLNKLPGQINNVWIGSNSNMTIDACLNLCRGFSLPYAGLEFSNECYCGDSFGRYGQVNESDCNFKCSGNPTQICGGIDRLSIYSVRVLVRSELIVVFNGSQLPNNSTIRLIETITPSFQSWIDYSRKTGEILININNQTLIRLKTIRADLSTNNYIIILNLRGNQLATYYNCYIVDAIMLNNSLMTDIFLSFNTQPVYGQVIFNKNVNDIFETFGCINYADAYKQIFTQTNNLVKGYCKLALDDIKNVNGQVESIINRLISYNTTVTNSINLIEYKLKHCLNINFPNYYNHHVNQLKKSTFD